MADRRIMYVCSECSDGCPEACGHYDRNDLRLMPSGQWLCESCFDETDQHDRGNQDEEVYKGWCDMPAPPEYGPLSSPPVGGVAKWKLTKAARNLKEGQRLCPRCAGSGHWVEKDQLCYRCQGAGTVPSEERGTQ